MLNQYFVKQAVKEVEIESFVRTAFPQGDYSKIELQRTPLGIKVIIHTNKPGRIIGKAGKNINDITEALKKRFGLENPQIDVKSIESPDTDAHIVAKQIAGALEKGFNAKKIGNLTLKRILDAGAVGAELIISGMAGTRKSSTVKFIGGYLKHCGEPARELVDYALEEAITKRGKIGIKVKIMREFQDITGEVRSVVVPVTAVVAPAEPVEDEPAKKKRAKPAAAAAPAPAEPAPAPAGDAPEE